MPSIDIDDSEFAQLMFILANAEGKGINWTLVNPLMMKIGGQARNQAAGRQQGGLPPANLGMVSPAPPRMRGQRNSGPEAEP